MKPKKGITDREVLLANLEPVLNAGAYVFTTVATTEGIDRNDIICEFKEAEGIALVLRREAADRQALPYDYVAAWITLSVHSALSAVGLTAAFSAALARHDISCNVLAGYYHDHLFVAEQDRDRAMRVLRELSAQHRPGQR